MRTAQTQAGVMLIEALIGILIFSIGILALLGMQGSAIKNTADARYRSEAAFLASRIVGQMWVDMNNLENYKTDGTALVPDYDPLVRWKDDVAKYLPGVDLDNNLLLPSIDVGPNPGLGLADREVRVRVQWQQPGETETRQIVVLNRIHPGTP